MFLVVGALIGMIIGYFMPYQLPQAYAKYVSVSFLAGLDSHVGAIRADIEDKYDPWVFMSGFVSNALLAAALTFLGDRLGVDLYLAALVTFGVRIFENLGWIRRDLIVKNREARKKAREDASLAAEASAPPQPSPAIAPAVSATSQA